MQPQWTEEVFNEISRVSSIFRFFVPMEQMGRIYKTTSIFFYRAARRVTVKSGPVFRFRPNRLVLSFFDQMNLQEENKTVRALFRINWSLCQTFPIRVNVPFHPSIWVNLSSKGLSIVKTNETAVDKATMGPSLILYQLRLSSFHFKVAILFRMLSSLNYVVDNWEALGNEFLRTFKDQQFLLAALKGLRNGVM